MFFAFVLLCCLVFHMIEKYFPYAISILSITYTYNIYYLNRTTNILKDTAPHAMCTIILIVFHKLRIINSQASSTTPSTKCNCNTMKTSTATHSTIMAQCTRITPPQITTFPRRCFSPHPSGQLTNTCSHTFSMCT